MALYISLSTWVSNGYTGDKIRWDLYEAGTGAFVDSHVENGPHGQVYNFSFVNNIRNIVYRIDQYDVPAGAVLGNLIKSHNITVNAQSVDFVDPIELIVGGPNPEDPVANQDRVTIAALIGKKIVFQQRAIGHLNAVRSPEYTFDNTTGEIILIGGQQFTNMDRFVIYVEPVIVMLAPGTVGGGTFSAVEEEANDRTLISADFGKLIIVEGGGPVIQFKLPAISLIVEKVPLTIWNIGKAHRYLAIAAQSGELITGTGRDRNTFYLAKGENCKLLRVGTRLYFETDSIDIRRVGQFEWGEYVGLNRLLRDGSEYNQADYPRLVEALNALPVGQVITSLATWNTTQVIGFKTVFIYHSRFAMYTTAGVAKFRVPNDLNLTIRAIKNIGGVDATRFGNVPGGYQHEALLTHDHKIWGQDNDASPTGATSNEVANIEQPGTAGAIYFRTTEAVGAADNITSNGAKLPLVIL